MTKYWCVCLIVMFCGYFVRGEDESPFLQEPQIKIVCNQGVRADGYSRLATNMTEATFNYVFVRDPIPKDEWEMSGPETSWTISPDLKKGSFVPFGAKAQLNLRLSDYGVSYVIEATLTWVLTHRESRRTVRKSCSANYSLDAVFYCFIMFCSDGTVSRNKSLLVDNHPARVKIVAEGCSRPELLVFSFTSRPDVEGTPINKKGTGMEFIKENSLEFRVPKTFWYGLEKPQCCYTNRFPYEIRLHEANDGAVDVQWMSVGMPEGEDAVVKMTPKDPDYTVKVDAVRGRYLATVTMSEFERIISMEGVEGITDQYAEETRKEEEFHVRQNQKDTSWAEGGEPDIYSAEKVREKVRKKVRTGYDGSISFYSYAGESVGDVSNRVVELIEDELKEEKLLSARVWFSNRNYRELKAKLHAGYNAAWMYHCTYENAENPETNVVHKTRQEIEKEMEEEKSHEEEE